MSAGKRRRAARGPGLFRIGGEISRTRFVLIAVAAFAVLFAAWWLITGLGLIQPLFLPSPSAVWQALSDQYHNGQLFQDIGVSAFRILVGFAIATVMAIPIGVLIGSFRGWEAAIEPLVDFVRYMPVVAFVPLTIVWIGIGNTQKFVIIWIGTFFQEVLLIMDDTKRVPLPMINLGRTLGMRDSEILLRIVVPASAPAIWDSIRISLGWAWTWLVLAEIVAATSGLGYRITVGQRYFETNLIIGYILVLGVLGLLTDQVTKAIGRRVFRYAEIRR